MEIRKLTTVDVHYYKSEIELAEKERKCLEWFGYDFQQSDESGCRDYDFCDQYIKHAKWRTKFAKKAKT